MVVDAGAVDGSAPEWAEALDGLGDTGDVPGGQPVRRPREGDVYERLIGDGRLDGLIVAFAALDDRHVAQLAERGIPLVLVNRRTSGVHGSVVVDDVRGSATAVDHLVRLGHRRIGLIGLAADTDTARRREAGYREAMAAAGLPMDERWVEAGPPTVEGGRAALYRLLAASRHAPAHGHRGGEPDERRGRAVRAARFGPPGARTTSPSWPSTTTRSRTTPRHP